MKLGIIGPLEIVDKIMQIIKREFHQIQPVAYIYKVYTETPMLIQDQQEHLDVILFAGSTPMSYAEKHVKATIPWEFIPRSGSSLLRSLLQITLLKKHNLFRVSSDLYDLNQLSETYEEIGINKDQFKIYAINKTPLDENYIDYVCAFHEHNYLCNQVSCCITALYNVHERLTAKNIPCYRIDATANIIRQTLHKMQLHYLVQISQQNQIVAMYVQIDSHSEYSLLNDNEYQYIINKTNVARQIYLFAQRIKAAVIEIGVREFLLFSTRHLLESVTNNFENIDLLQSVQKNTSSTISIGMGYGQTAQEAKFNANLGMERASSLGGDLAFIVHNTNKIIGPIRRNEDQQQEKSDHKIDKKFLTVSEKSGISVNTVYELYCIVEQQGKTRFTSFELANLAGVTPRTMNRILSKLVMHGFCFDVGKRILKNAGRPSRIFEISIP